MDTATVAGPLAVIERIRRAVDAHDLEALAACFQPGYRSEQPLHPDRAFRGREQLRTNWSQIFAAVPDIRATVLRCATDGATVWTEWDLRGTRRDGTPQHTAMVTIGGVHEGQIAWMRLYMEQVSAGAGIDAAVREGLAEGGRGR
jgi:ketosteroid isomerase-like protein